jgi:hypothetical protein
MGIQMRTRSGWFDLYAAAILENDLDKVSQRVTSARKAIADRIAQLEAGELAANREGRDLEDALNKLQILVNVSCAMQDTRPSAGASSGIGYQQASN